VNNADQPTTTVQVEQNLQTQTPIQPSSTTNTIQDADRAQRIPGSIRLRLSAMIFDNLILAVPINFLTSLSWYIFGNSFSSTSSSTSIILLLLFSIAGLGYYIYFNVKKGATPGKSIYGLKVVDIATDSNLTYKYSTIRELINRGILSIPILGLIFAFVNFLVVLSKPERRGIHDKAAHSQVYRVEKSWSFIKQLGLFIALIILGAAPFLLVIPQYFSQTQNLNSCVMKCMESKATTNNLEANFQEFGEICFQECSTR